MQDVDPADGERTLSDGNATMLLRRSGRRYTAGMRIATSVPACTVACLLAGDVRAPTMLAVTLTAFLGWSMIYCWLMIFRAPPPWVTAIDVATVAGVGVSAQWTVPPDWLTGGRSWMLPVAAFACVGYQYSTKWSLGGPAALIVVISLVAGIWLAIPVGTTSPSLVTGAWTAVIALLARGLWKLLESGGRAADLATAEAERARYEEELSEARRSAERRHSADLHDTATITMMLVNRGAIQSGSDTLKERARRDVLTLTSGHLQPDRMTDVVALVQEVVDLAAVDVDFSAPVPFTMRPDVAQALKKATEEALNNVYRHARASSCRVVLIGGPTGLTIEVADNGIGFDPEAGSGYGMGNSIKGRLAYVGGSAVVESTPGAGTKILLGWPA